MNSIKSNKQFKKIPILVIATRNPAKTEYYKSVCHDVADRITDLSKFSFTDKPQESGQTAEENAIIKAKFYHQLTNLPVLCEDEALYVNFLPPDQQPGVHVRRIDKQTEATDQELIDYWQNIIKDIKPDQRSAYWEISYCIALSAINVQTFTRKYPRHFFYPPSSKTIPGWPMASIMGPLEFNRPFTELTPEQKFFIDNQAKPELSRAIKKLISESSKLK